MLQLLGCTIFTQLASLLTTDYLYLTSTTKGETVISLRRYHKWLLTCSVIDLESFHKSRAYGVKLRRVTKDVVKSEV